MCLINETTSYLESDHYVAHSVCSFTLSLVGMVGNAASVYLIRQGRLYKSPTMALLTNLCLADLVITAVILPLLGVNAFSRDWLYGDVFCQIFAYANSVTLTSEFLTLILITINQYLTVVRNVVVQRQPGQKWKLVLISLSPWLVTSVVYLLPLTRLWDEFGFDPRIHMCTLINPTGILGMKSTISVGLLLGSVAVIIYCYTAIYWVHHRSTRKTIPSHHASTTVAAAAGEAGASADRGTLRHAMNARNTQLIRMISVILLNFAATYIPFFLMYAVDPCLSRMPSSAVVAIVYISFSHSSTNPIIYAFMNKQIHAQWKLALARCLGTAPNARPENGDSQRNNRASGRRWTRRSGQGDQDRGIRESSEA